MFHFVTWQLLPNLTSEQGLLPSYSKRASSSPWSWKTSASTACSWVSQITTPSTLTCLSLKRHQVKTKSVSLIWTTIHVVTCLLAWRRYTLLWRTSIIWSITAACKLVFSWRASASTLTSPYDSGRVNSLRKTILITRSLKSNTPITSVIHTDKRVSAMTTRPGIATRRLTWLHLDQVSTMDAPSRPSRTRT